jgi:NADPH:quinone reductase-like Zn-dependent oxidoreductase
MRFSWRVADVRTIATVAADDIPFVRNLGADTVIDYQTQRFEEEVRDADAVIDLVGDETQTRSFQVLRRGGKPFELLAEGDHRST